MITADVIARAIVAACRETGEDPIKVSTGTPRLRARHYAMHALARAYPDVKKVRIVVMCGAPGKPDLFWANSLGQTVDRAAWWDKRALQRVVDAVFDEAGKTDEPIDVPAVLPARTPEPPAPTRDAEPPPAPRPSRAVPQRPNFATFTPASGRPPLHTRPAEKRALQDMLRAAVENTARMTPKE